jgi:tetratricopeptide (TPR) repeat protein
LRVGDNIVIRHGNDALFEETNRAIRLASEGRKDDALAIYGKIADKLPDNRENRAQLIRLCLNLGNAESAITLSRELSRNYPDNADYMTMLGQAYALNNQLHEAVYAFQKAVELDPGQWQAHADLGGVYSMLAQYDMGISHLEKALALKPSHAVCLANMTVCLAGAGRYREALDYSKKAIRAAPRNPTVYDTVASALAILGQIDEAISYYEKAIALDNSFGTSYMNFSRIKKFSDKDKQFIERMEKQLKKSLPAKERASFHFALGKAYDDRKIFDKAFANYRQGNLLYKSQRPELIDLKYVPKLFKKVFTKERLDMAPSIGNTSDIPIFIVGMPRTGSSLTEQIISRHSQAGGAGELQTIHFVTEAICPLHDQKNYITEWNKHLNQSKLNEYAESYLKVLRKDNEDALRITDKLPDNFFYLGFIHLLFPYAKVVHTIRNPLDTCLSCYFQPFTGLSWTFDMESLARRYQLYRQIMDYWKNVLPPGTILDINYESLINNQEEESRRLIAHCGLDWEDGCLDYVSEKRIVETASLWQVRQPMYKSSVRRWTNYAPHLETLAKGLSGYLDDEDVELLKQAGVKVKSRRWW